jgi:hypothetical protein
MRWTNLLLPLLLLPITAAALADGTGKDVQLIRADPPALPASLRGTGERLEVEFAVEISPFGNVIDLALDTGATPGEVVGAIADAMAHWHFEPAEDEEGRHTLSQFLQGAFIFDPASGRRGAVTLRGPFLTDTRPGPDLSEVCRVELERRYPDLPPEAHLRRSDFSGQAEPHWPVEAIDRGHQGAVVLLVPPGAFDRRGASYRPDTYAVEILWAEPGELFVAHAIRALGRYRLPADKGADRPQGGFCEIIRFRRSFAP